ncbi:MAG: ROK family protein, partial [Streptosporangiaceae bacterium]
MAVDTTHTVLALDIGGTKISAAIVDARGRVLARARAATPKEGGDALTRPVLDLAAGITADAPSPPSGVGVSVAGAVEADGGTIAFAPNLPGLDGVPLGDLLSERLGIPACVVYDGHAGALGEHWRGAGRGARGMAFLIVGTGIGGGLILDGRLRRGARGIAGAAGWMVVDPEATSSPEVGALGSLEAAAAGPGLAAEARRSGLGDAAT